MNNGINEKPDNEPENLSNYYFLKTIGKGTFGKVKLGVHIPTNEKVAIKVLEKSKIQSKKDLERIQKEIKYLKLFNHPNIVKIYEIVEDETNFYIIMEYVSGGELFNYIVKNKRLNEQETSFFYSQIIHIIKEIHKFKICHRDIKPENLLLTSNKTLKIIDFGLSNEYCDFLYTPCGSPCYASPEIISGNQYSGIAIDLWASGIILFSMLCGYLPFDDKDNDTLFSKILQCKVVFPKKYHLSEEAKDLIKKILQPNPTKRINLEEILNHPFLAYGNKRYKEKVNTGIFKQDELLINYMINEMKIPNEIELRKSILNNKHNGYTTTFNLLKKKYIEGRLNYSFKKSKTPMNFCIINPERKNNFIRSSRSIRKTLLACRYKEIENKKLNNNSLVKDIGNMIKQKFNENNNNIIIINNTDSSIHQPIKMNSLIHNLFTDNRNNNTINNNTVNNNSINNSSINNSIINNTKQNILSNSVNYRNNLRKISRKINSSVSIEKHLKEKLRGFNTSRVNNKLIKNEDHIQMQSPIISGYRLSKIKGKHARPKKYLNISLVNDSLVYSNNTMNISNNLPNNENYIIEPEYKTRHRLGTSVNRCFENNFINKNLYHQNEYKKKIISGLYIKCIANLDNSKKKIMHSWENSKDKDPKNSNKNDNNFNNSVENIDAVLNESINKANNSYYNTNNNINIEDENFNKNLNYNNKENIINSEIKPLNKHFRKLKYITLSNINKNNNKSIYDQSEKTKNKYLKTSPDLKGYEETSKISNKIGKMLPEKITVNKNKELPFYMREKLSLNLSSAGAGTRTEQKILNQRKAIYYSKKVTKPINCPKKETTLMKKYNTEYLLASVKLTAIKIREIIKKFCKEEGFTFIKDNIKFTIFLDKSKKNSFIAEIKTNDQDCNHEIKLIHNSGDEIKTKIIMKKLLFAVVK